ncbi:amidohydrolase [Cnuella takakiae]|nr:amidohydrolase [Cnuella takakiae]
MHAQKTTKEDASLFYDSHFHLTNYIQKGLDQQSLLAVLSNKVGRSTLFGIPLQQQWSYRVTGKRAPTYYLETDAPLYYYSFTDAAIAMFYKSLPKEQQTRFDPMITGFNPTDMYAADHIRRVLLTFPGVFSGIGEFTIHKEFVSSKVAGDVASLTDPALDSIFELTEEVGLISILHNDIDNPFPKTKDQNYLGEVKALFRRHPNATIIWAHIGLGRIIHPVQDQVTLVEEMLNDPALKHVFFDISWDEVAKYLVQSDQTVQAVAALINRYPDRFLFGTDNVAPASTSAHLKVYNQYQPLWQALTPKASEMVRKGNYQRLFDEARRKVRLWESKQGLAAMANQ